MSWNILSYNDKILLLRWAGMTAFFFPHPDRCGGPPEGPPQAEHPGVYNGHGDGPVKSHPAECIGGISPHPGAGLVKGKSGAALDLSRSGWHPYGVATMTNRLGGWRWYTAIRSAAACLDGPIVANVGLPSLATDRRGIQWHPVRVASMTHKTDTARPTEPAGHSGQGRRVHLDGTRNGWQPPKHGLGDSTS